MLISITMMTMAMDRKDNDKLMLQEEFVRPGVTAAQLRLQPGFVFLASVWKKISTVLVLVTMTGGRK